ncbi:MAG: MotA/TolQ/ExbB proton channel family protein [Bacteroidales bacterium]|nr:MotA/TolQ/ExbB proton channel family protein [Bacteroidales bacterium]
MKKVFALLAILGLFTFGATSMYAQDDQNDQNVEQTEQVQEVAPVQKAATDVFASSGDDQPFHQVLKTKFIEGGVGWMSPILILLIIGLALCIERMIYLGLSKTNNKKLLADIEAYMKKGDIAGAKELCRNTRGPVASIFFQGLDRYNEGLDNVEKAVVSYGGVQMGNLEKGLSWITLFIALAPSLGFLGTVVGLVVAFDNIERAGDISPTIVAGGMKMALLTTVFGLIVAIILQVLYNFCLTQIESIVNDMEDSSISFMDILTEYK